MRSAIYGAGSLGTVLGAYITKNGLISEFIGGADAVAYMTQYQKDYLAKIGK